MTKRNRIEIADRHSFAECRLRAEIKIVPPNSLPNDGKVIEDRRAIGVGV